MAKITIKDIARYAGVSPGTVDRIIHNRGRYSSETEMRVRAVMEELDYQPNILARTLSLSADGVLAAVLPYPRQDSEYWELPALGIRKAEKALRHWNIQVQFFHFDRNRVDTFETALKEAVAIEPGGLILAPVAGGETARVIRSCAGNIPVVLVDTIVSDVEYIHYIGQDSYRSGRLAGFLMQKVIGFPAVIAVAGPENRNQHLDQRERGFIDLLTETEKVRILSLAVSEPDNRDEWREKLFKLQSDADGRIDGYFCLDASVHHIAACIDRVNLNGRVKPVLIGYDLVEQNRQALCTDSVDFILTQRPESQGYESVHLLYRYLFLKEKTQSDLLMPLEIVTRENIP